MNKIEINKDAFEKYVNDGFKVVDVRSVGEDKLTGLSYDAALKIPYPGVVNKAEQFFPNKDEKLIIVCNYGSRSGLTAKTYRQMGYNNVYVLAGGLAELK